MNLNFDISGINQYTSHSQIARVITQRWMTNNMFCPRCGENILSPFPENYPVADFHYKSCKNEYELKSKNGNLSSKITDGAYSTMIKRITSNSNPDLFCMEYSKKIYTVNNLVLIPKYFFTPEIIEKRKPLADTARRAEWIGCNILINKVPSQGMIPIIHNDEVLDKPTIILKTNKTKSLEKQDITSRGWLLDTLLCVNQIPNIEFTLNEMYQFEEYLYIKHPNNNNIRAKIRQQLQFLGNKGYITFLGNRRYHKIL